MALKEVIHVTNQHVKNSRVMMTVKSRGFYFVKAHEMIVILMAPGESLPIMVIFVIFTGLWVPYSKIL